MSRDFTVATFVVHSHQLLLLHHAKLRMWLPPGGHIEVDELPDDAAVREVWEEAGIRVRLVGERALPISKPRQLVIPKGVQVEAIAPGHEHIDLVYFAVPIDSVEIRANAESTGIGWFDAPTLKEMELTDEIRLWSRKALDEL